MSGFVLVDDLRLPKADHGPERPRRSPLNCPGCGRFVKVGRYVPYCNGWFNCARTEYVCAHCGPGSIEHV